MIIRPYPGHIIFPRTYAELEMPKHTVGVKGRYMLRVIDAETKATVRETPWFDNIILDSGLNRWGTGSIIDGAAIGTGTSIPAATDTALQSQTTFTTTTGVGSGIVAGTSPNFNNTRTFVYRTALGALNGNFTEVGIGWASGSMFSRALILDNLGNPTSIAVSSSQQLDIFYQLSVFPPLVDVTGNVTISGVDYSYTGRAMSVSNSSSAWSVSSSALSFGSFAGSQTNVWSGNIGAITSSPSGSSGGYSSVTSAAYSNNSLQREGSYTYNLTFGNVAGGILSAASALSGLGWFQYQFNPVIPKNNTRTLVLNYRVGWARR